MSFVLEPSISQIDLFIFESLYFETKSKCPYSFSLIIRNQVVWVICGACDPPGHIGLRITSPLATHIVCIINIDPIPSHGATAGGGRLKVPVSTSRCCLTSQGTISPFFDI